MQAWNNENDWLVSVEASFISFKRRETMQQKEGSLWAWIDWKAYITIFTRGLRAYRALALHATLKRHDYDDSNLVDWR